MGLLAPVADFLLHEHSYKRITGEVLFIGRQTVFLDEISLKPMLYKHGITDPLPLPIQYDSETVGVQGQCITDRYFMRCLGVPRVRFMDVSDYEGADIVHDLGYPVPKELHNSFDFIYNGGCLDNMFNPGEAMMNLSKMLKPGGRIVCMESASSWNSPYLMYSPGWFHDYYATNGFVDCKVYVCSYPSNDELFYGPWKTFYFDIKQNKNGGPPEAIYGNHLILLTIAEKGKDSTSDRQPIQFQYRHDKKLNESLDLAETSFRNSPRPIINGIKVNGAKSYGTLSRIANRLGIRSVYRNHIDLRSTGELGNY